MIFRRHKEYLDAAELAPSATSDETAEHTENELVSDNPAVTGAGQALPE